MLTIDDIQKEHTRLGEAIQALLATAAHTGPQLLQLHGLTIELQPGEHYAGLVLHAATGTPLHHLVLLPGDRDDITWADAGAWAESIGGTLPTRQEQAQLYANLKRCFEGSWYWSSETHEEDGSYAWSQYFDGGGRSLSHKSYEGRARAVRRLAA